MSFFQKYFGECLVAGGIVGYLYAVAAIYMTSKKDRERWIMDLFIENYKAIKITILRQQESPDFIVRLRGGEIGIELTEVFQDSHLGSSKLKQRSSDGSSFTEYLIELIQPKIPFTFLIGINFNPTHHIKKSKKIEILNKLQEICVTSAIKLKNHDHLEIENYYNNLPIEIDDIFISRYDGMEESIDYRPEGGSVSNLTFDHIKPILESKEKILPSYKKCDEQWLLIREGNYFAGSFSSIEMDLPIESAFNKVYLFRTRSREIVELK